MPYIKNTCISEVHFYIECSNSYVFCHTCKLLLSSFKLTSLTAQDSSLSQLYAAVGLDRQRILPRSSDTTTRSGASYKQTEPDMTDGEAAMVMRPSKYIVDRDTVL